MVTTALAPVIPLRHKHTHDVTAVKEPPSATEPARLYGLVCLAFVLHVPIPGGGLCGQCGQPWPCAHLRLAYRIREGF